MSNRDDAAFNRHNPSVGSIWGNREDLQNEIRRLSAYIKEKNAEVNKYAMELHEMENALISANNTIAAYRDWFTEHEHIIAKEIYLKKALLEHGDNERS